MLNLNQLLTSDCYLIEHRRLDLTVNHRIRYCNLISFTVTIKIKTFKYLGSLLTNQNSLQEEIKCRLKAGNSCYYSVYYNQVWQPKVKGNNQGLFCAVHLSSH